MNLIQNVRIALNSIRGNLTRTIITCMIIAIGIMALVGILTAIDGVESSLTQNFSYMGANSFNIQNSGLNISLGRNTKRERFDYITYKQATEFKERFKYNAQVSVFSNNSQSAIMKYRSEKTNPNTVITGGDETYLRVSGNQLAEGRNINFSDVRMNNPVVIIGPEIKDVLFPTGDALDKVISCNGVRLRVIGVLEPKGGAFNFNGDRVVIVPVTLARAKFPKGIDNYNISVAVEDVLAMESAIDYSIALMRQVRKLRVKDKDNFSIVKSDSITQALLESLDKLLLAAIFIAVITLLGAAIALMNIMLVSVTERTKEIGTRKAIGAKRSTVLGQFVIEAITICQIGGIGGVLLGILVGNLTSRVIGGSFIIPWNWMGLAVLVCTLVGLTAGIWPALKASRIHPIEALRHE